MDKKSVVRRPGYIAFRVRERGRLISVVAILRAGGSTDPPWAFWHSSFAPWGELRRAPANYLELEIDERTAKRMIYLFGRGESLPEEVSSGLPILVVPDSLAV
jgi:hypothetical protein